MSYEGQGPDPITKAFLLSTVAYIPARYSARFQIETGRNPYVVWMRERMTTDDEAIGILGLSERFIELANGEFYLKPNAYQAYQLLDRVLHVPGLMSRRMQYDFCKAHDITPDQLVAERDGPLPDFVIEILMMFQDRTNRYGIVWPNDIEAIVRKEETCQQMLGCYRGPFMEDNAQGYRVYIKTEDALTEAELFYRSKTDSHWKGHWPVATHEAYLQNVLMRYAAHLLAMADVREATVNFVKREKPSEYEEAEDRHRASMDAYLGWLDWYKRQSTQDFLRATANVRYMRAAMAESNTAAQGKRPVLTLSGPYPNPTLNG